MDFIPFAGIIDKNTLKKKVGQSCMSLEEAALAAGETEHSPHPQGWDRRRGQVHDCQWTSLYGRP